MLVVTEYQLKPALLDRVPFARVEHGLEFIKAGRRSGPVTIAVPGKPAAAVYPHAQPVEGGKDSQADSQPRDGHEEYGAHNDG